MPGLRRAAIESPENDPKSSHAVRSRLLVSLRAARGPPFGSCAVLCFLGDCKCILVCSLRFASSLPMASLCTDRSRNVLRLLFPTDGADEGLDSGRAHALCQGTEDAPVAAWTVHATDGEHEGDLVIRGRTVLWATACARGTPHVVRSFTTNTPPKQAVWCTFSEDGRPALCVAELHTITVFDSNGEVFFVPAPFAIGALLPVRRGLLIARHMAQSQVLSVCVCVCVC
jgi:hypothetical protein